MNDALRLPSVTTIIDGGLGTSPALTNWVARTVATTAVDQPDVIGAMLKVGDRDGAIAYLAQSRYRSSNRAKIRGSQVHQLAEAVALGLEPTVPPEHEGYYRQLLGWLEAFKPRYISAEAAVYNLTFGYAGTLDGIVEIDGQTLLFDIKTTEHGPNSERTRPPFESSALQLVAYASAEQLGLGAPERVQEARGRFYRYDPDAHYLPMPPIDGAFVLVLSPEDCIAVPVRIDEEVWSYFVYVRENFRWREEGSMSLFGPPFDPPRHGGLELVS
jgi:hypothetical protein